MTSTRLRIAGWTAAAVLVCVAVGAYWLVRRRDRLPPANSQAYEDVVRRFYRGLASLEVGLLDDAKREFAEATVVVPNEPASWANLGLARLRLPAAKVLAKRRCQPFGLLLILSCHAARLIDGISPAKRVDSCAGLRP